MNEREGGETQPVRDAFFFQSDTRKKIACSYIIHASHMFYIVFDLNNSFEHRHDRGNSFLRCAPRQASCDDEGFLLDAFSDFPDFLQDRSIAMCIYIYYSRDDYRIAQCLLRGFRWRLSSSFQHCYQGLRLDKWPKSLLSDRTIGRKKIDKSIWDLRKQKKRKMDDLCRCWRRGKANDDLPQFVRRGNEEKANIPVEFAHLIFK